MNSQGTILISYIGYITQEIKVDKNDKLIITLEEDTENIGRSSGGSYGAIQKRSVSTAISTVKGGKSQRCRHQIYHKALWVCRQVSPYNKSVESREPLRQSGSEEQAPSIAEMTPYL